MSTKTLLLALTTAALTLGVSVAAQAQQTVTENGDARDGFHRGRGFGDGEARMGARGGERRGMRMMQRFERRGAPLENLDTNDDGVIDQDEFLAGGAQREGRLLAQRDADGDGLLSREELEARAPRRPDIDREAVLECVQELHPEFGPDGDLAARFDTLDTSDDGFLDAEELAAGQRERALQHFAELDADADGTLTREELRSSMRERRDERRDVQRDLRDCVRAEANATN